MTFPRLFWEMDVRIGTSYSAARLCTLRIRFV